MWQDFFIMLRAYVAGCTVGASLIVAIGAQNATLLRIGLRRHYVAIAVAICVLGDASLIALGIGGFGSLLSHHHFILNTMQWLGFFYLAWFAISSFRSAWRGGVTLDESSQPTATNVFITMAAVTWLNPHVYVDTVMVIGTVSTHFANNAWWFGAGALTSSVLWFSALGFGARFLRPLFQSPTTWRVFDVVVGIIVGGVAISLLPR